MNRPLKILLLEDDPVDAELIQRLLKKERSCDITVAHDKNTFSSFMEQQEPDIILSDHSLSAFNSTEALRMVRQRFFHIPFILVTGTVSEEYAATIINEGADDYILKDRMARLPAAIDFALKRRKAIKELRDYKYAVDQMATVAITNKEGVITYVNEQFSLQSGFTSEEIIGKTHKLINSGYHPDSFFKELWETIASGKIWNGEICNRTKSGRLYWMRTTIVPLLDEKGTPAQYISIRVNIDDEKRLEEELSRQKRQEQLKLAATALEAQEKERNDIAQELHDNVNQILVGTKLMLSSCEDDKADKAEILRECMSNLQRAIDENRKIAHQHVTPDLVTFRLSEQVTEVTNMMLKPQHINVHLDTEGFNENLLSVTAKLAVYRIIQEQCTNIVKYAEAKHVYIRLLTEPTRFLLQVRDDGKGADEQLLSGGIGLQNIKARLAVLNGTVTILSEKGKGFLLVAEIPV